MAINAPFLSRLSVCGVESGEWAGFRGRLLVLRGDIEGKLTPFIFFPAKIAVSIATSRGTRSSMDNSSDESVSTTTFLTTLMPAFGRRGLIKVGTFSGISVIILLSLGWL
jgi:hypothetical protein